MSLLPLPPVFGRGSASLLLQGGPLLPLTVEKSLGYFVILSALSAQPFGMQEKLRVDATRFGIKKKTACLCRKSCEDCNWREVLCGEMAISVAAGR